MAKWLSFFRLIRPVNLVFIVITQYLFRYMIVLPIFDNYAVAAALSPFQFAGLVLSTVLIAAGGYAINDYFDIQMDQVNKPRHIVVGRTISRRWTMVIHIILSALGLLMGAAIAWSIGRIHLVIIHLGAAGMLWLYSTLLKRLPFVGNVAVSLLTSLVVVIVALFELWIINRPPSYTGAAQDIFVYTVIYAGFAFLISMVREIVKDIEDMQGDGEADAKTLPIVFGMRGAKLVAAAFALTTLFFTVIFQLNPSVYNYFGLLVFGIILIQAPLMLLLLGLYWGDKKVDFTRLSGWIKLIMLTGILSMFILNYFAAPSSYL